MSEFAIPRPGWVSDRLVADPECGPNAGFQMYTREGNDTVAEMVLGVIRGAQVERSTRAEFVRHLIQAIARVAVRHPEVYDTEPECAIVDAVNAYFDTQGWVHIGRGDL